MPATTEPLGATASSRSVSRLRRSKHDATTPDNDSTPSLASRTSSLGDDSAAVRSSMDAALDKVRERTRKSIDERRGSEESASGARLSALLERGARKLKRKEKNNNGASTLSVNHSGESGELAFSDGGRSEGSLLDEDDGNSSLLTDDGSENDGYVSTFSYLLPSSHPAIHPYRYTCNCSVMSMQPVACTCQHRHAPSSAPALASRTRTFRRRSRIVVSRYDLPRSLHLANAPTCSCPRVLGGISLPVDVGFSTISFLLLYHCHFFKSVPTFVALVNS